MGLTYQELKRLGKHSIVLEKQENIEIQQNSSSYCSKKRRLIREKFYSDHPKETESQNVGKHISKKRNKLGSPKVSEVISKFYLHSLALEEKKNKRFEEKVDKTSMHLDYLQQVINNEIEKLKKRRSNLVMEMKGEKIVPDKDFTWAENLANNCPWDQRPDSIAKEKFSSEHQGVFTSPRYGSDQDVALRPRTRSVASQIDTLPMGADKGAVGDHNSFNSFDHNKIQELSNSIKDILLTPSVPRKQDQIVNCCYNHTFHPITECYNTAGIGAGTGSFVCHHRNIQQSSVQPQREYKYCCDEYCYNYNPCNQPPAHCYCATPANSKHINIGACRSCYGRHCTDLNTDKFYCRSKSKSEKEITESRRKHQETCEEYGERKKRECREKLDKKREKLQRNMSREPMLPNSSKLVQHLDRYVDERKKCVNSLLKKHKKLAGKFYEDSSTSTVKISSESKICCITVHSKPNEHYDDGSINSRYSVETLRMLKRMKIRKYVASKPHSVEKEKTDAAKHVQKMKKYQEYLEKYKNEERGSIAKQTSNEPIQILKEPPQIFKTPESEKLLQQRRTSRNLSLSEEQPQTSVGQRRESSHSKESTEESTNKRNNTQTLGKDESYEELRYEYGREKTENLASGSRDSKAIVKLDIKTHRVFKDNDNKSYDREKVNRESEDHQEERPYRYKSSEDNERESIVNKDLYDREIRKSLKDQKDEVYRTSYDNYKLEEIPPIKLEKRSIEHGRGSYGEPILKQEKETDQENGYRISDDKKLTEQVLEKPDPDEVVQHDQIARTYSVSREQPQNTERQPKGTNFSKELAEQSTSKRRSTQPLERDAGYDELRDSQAFEKLDPKTYRDSKDYDYKPYSREKVNKDSEDYQKARSYKYRSSKDNERESIVNKELYDREIRKNLKDQTDGVYRSSYDNYKPEEIPAIKLEKRSIEYGRESYREPIIRQVKETDLENGYRISDDKKLTEQYRPSFPINDPPQAPEKPKPEEVVHQDQIARTYSVSREQLQNTVRQPRGSNFSKELAEQSTSKRRSTQPLERDAGYDELRNSQAFEKLDPKTHRDSKDYDYKPYSREKVNKESEDYQKARSYKYRSSKDNERESIINKELYDREIRESLKDQKDGVYRASYDNYKPEEILPIKLEKQSIEYGRGSYREPIIKQEKEKNHENGHRISEEIAPRKFTKRIPEYDKDNYRERKIKQERGTYYENGYGFSDDKKLKEQYRSSFSLNEPPRVFEEAEPGKLLQQDEATSTLSLLEEQPHYTAISLRESYYSQDPIEQSGNKRRITQPLERDENYEDLPYDGGVRRTKDTISGWNDQERDSKAFEEPETNFQRNSKDYDDKFHGRESIDRAPQDYQDEELYMYRSSIDNVRGTVVNRTLKEQQDRSYRASYDSDKSKEIAPRKSEKQSEVIDYHRLVDPAFLSNNPPKVSDESETYYSTEPTEQPTSSRRYTNPLEKDKRNNNENEKLRAQNRTSFSANPESYRARRSSLQAKEPNIYDETKQTKTPKASTSSSYRNFKEAMDHNMGFYSETSSQANYTTENEIIQPESAKTFTKEIKPEKEPYMCKNTEEALQYLRGFLNSYQQFDLDEECSNSVGTVAQDLINKLSSCKINKSRTHTTLEDEITSRTEYKDPESTPNTSQPQLEEEQGNVMVNEDNYRVNNITEKEPPLEATPPYSYFEKGVDRYQNLSDNQHWQPSEKYQRYLGLVNEDHFQYSSSTQMPNSSQYLENVSESPLTHDNEYNEQAPDDYDTNFPLSSYESEYYEPYRPQPRSMSVYPLCSREVLPIKGILKPSRAMEYNQNISCDLVTNATVSTVNTEHASHINLRTDTLLRCAQGHKEIDHQSNKSLQTVIANDQNTEPSVEYSDHRHTVATNAGQPLYEGLLQNNDVSNYDEEDNNRFLYTVGLPNFRQCPCMLNTYLKMLETYYRAGNK